MVMQSDASVVVVLSEESCVPWGGLLLGEKEASLEGFQLRRESVSRGPGFTAVCLLVYDRRTKQQRRKLWAIHYHAWNEHGVPDSVAQFYRMTQELDSLRMQCTGSVGGVTDASVAAKRDSLVVVCRTGSGRSGMFILFDFMRLCLDFNQSVDMARVLTHMRIQVCVSSLLDC